MGYGTYRAGRYAGTNPTPPKVPGAVNGGERRSFTERFDLSNALVTKTAGGFNDICDIPAGHAVQSVNVTSSVSLATSQLQFGTAASPAAYGPAKAYGTTPETHVTYLPAAQKGVIIDAPIRLRMGITTADLPNAGIVVVEVITSAKG